MLLEHCKQIKNRSIFPGIDKIGEWPGIQSLKYNISFSHWTGGQENKTAENFISLR